MSPRAQTRADRPLGPTFRALLAASAVSNLGDGIRLATLPLLATTLTNSPLLIAGVTVAQFLPWLLFGPIGGVIVDRSDRRRLILTTQLWRAIVMVVLAAVVIADAASIQLIFLVAFVITAGEILVDPSVVAVVPTIVARDDLDRANGRISGVEIVTNDLVGAPVGVGLFAVASWLPFAVDGASYLGSTLLFRRLP
ncbi:MAG: MFS transporter, partial [Actinomycetota bacterium]